MLISIKHNNKIYNKGDPYGKFTNNLKSLSELLQLPEKARHKNHKSIPHRPFTVSLADIY